MRERERVRRIFQHRCEKMRLLISQRDTQAYRRVRVARRRIKATRRF